MRDARAAWIALGASVIALGLSASGLRAQRSAAGVEAPLFPGPADVVRVGPIPAGLASVDAGSCGGCHEDEAERWSDSMHRRSATDPFFVAGYRLDHQVFCRNCHAPRAPPAGPHGAPEASGLALRDGVDCATCHVRDGFVLASRVTDAGQRAHAMRREPRLESSSFCAGCHQFRFPAPPLVARAVYDPAGWMQRTATEHRGSWAHAAGRTCQSCHMPGSDHRVLGLRDEAFLRDAVDVRVEAERFGARTRVRATIDPRGVGHAFPTGDMLRRIEVRAWIAGDEAGAARRTLGRVFRAGPTPPDAPHPRLRQVADHRIPAGQRREVRLTLPRPASEVRVSVGLLRLTDAMARAQGVPRQSARVPIHTLRAVVRRRGEPR